MPSNKSQKKRATTTTTGDAARPPQATASGCCVLCIKIILILDVILIAMVAILAKYVIGEEHVWSLLSVLWQPPGANPSVVDVTIVNQLLRDDVSVLSKPSASHS